MCVVSYYVCCILFVMLCVSELEMVEDDKKKSRIVGNILKMSSGWKQKNCQDMHFIEQAVLIFAKLKAGDGRGSPHLVRLSISV